VSLRVREQYGRVAQFDPTTPNLSAGGHPGSVMFANTCHCEFYRSTYPWAYGPRLGVAYQLNSKTVFRGGWGVVYQFPTDDGVLTIGSNAVNAPAGVNPFLDIGAPGAILQPVWPVTNPYVYPTPGATTPFPYNPDRQFNRPPRQNQWSIGFQREITPNLLMEAAYVANRDVWLNGSMAGTPGFLSQLSPAVFAPYGVYPYPGTGPTGYTLAQNYADFQLLSQPINSASVMARMKAAGVGNGGLLLPYTGFPLTNSLMSALYPFPQFGALAVAESPTGGTKYDSLQMKATKRFSRGLQAAGAFTFAKSFVRANRQDFFNPQSSVWTLQQIPLRQLTFNVTYVTPRAPFLTNKLANWVTKDWQIGAFVIYQSAPFLVPPSATTANLLGSEQTRIPGQPLYTEDINGQINPYTEQILNPAAWANVPAGQVGPAVGTLYADFRGRRRPFENANFGRNFRIKESYNLQIRVEFTNIFNRTLIPSPSTAMAPQNPLTKNNQGQYTAGFGIINATAALDTVPTLNGASRAGTLIARFTF